MDSSSAMSPSPLPLAKPKSASRDWRFGKRTLSSLALPSLELGSSCSRSIENLAESPFIRRLVRKSSFDGKAEAKSMSSFFVSGSEFFFPRRNNEKEDSDSRDGRTSATSSFGPFFLVLKRFIVEVRSVPPKDRLGSCF